MKNITLWLRVLLVPLDLTMIALAIAIAYNYRAGVSEDVGILGITNVGLILPLSFYLGLFLISSPVWLFAFSNSGLYDLKRNFGLLDVFGRISLAVSSALTFSLALLFLTKTADISRAVLFNSWWLSILLVFLLRIIARAIEIWLWRQGIDVKKVAFLGANGITRELESAIARVPDGSYRCVGIVTNEDVENKIGSEAELRSLINSKKFDELWIMDVQKNRADLLEIVMDCQLAGVTVKLVPHGTDILLGKLVAEEFYGRPMLRVKRTPLEGWGKVVKRIIDFLLASVMLILFSPLLLLIALLIKFDSPGPAVFKQVRVGESGQFTLYKFRTMRAGAEEEHEKLIKKHGNMFKLKNDPRVTNLGRFLRKYSLDELPQLLNVLKGEMSLVGPRPPMPVEVEKYSLEEKRRLGIKPGLTGLWQISGRSDLSFEDWVMLDSYYIENWSLWLDLKIILKTILVFIAAKGAY